jgi:hypothetical protein
VVARRLRVARVGSAHAAGVTPVAVDLAARELAGLICERCATRLARVSERGRVSDVSRSLDDERARQGNAERNRQRILAEEEARALARPVEEVYSGAFKIER